MKRICLFFLLTLSIISCKQPKQQTAKGALSDLLNKYRNHKSISYSVSLKMKYYHHDDTAYRYSHPILIKDLKDTVFNGYVWFATKWGNYYYGRYYDLDSIYIIDDSLKKMTVYTDPKKQYWAITGNTAYELANTYFLDTSGLSKIVLDTTITATLTLDKVGNAQCWKVSVKLPNDEDVKDRWRTLWINTSDTTLKKMESHGDWQGSESYKEWDIDSIMFDKETPLTLKSKLKDKFSTYQISRYVPMDPEKTKPLANGLKAPLFSGTDFATGKKVSLADYKGKVVLLDFWYVGCGWCVKAFPAVDEVAERYAKKGLVTLGINSFDTTAELEKELPEFIKINKNTYPTILTSRKTDKSYNMYGYPTFYLINQKGYIAFSRDGYSPKLDSILSAEIDRLLKR